MNLQEHERNTSDASLALAVEIYLSRAFPYDFSIEHRGTVMGGYYRFAMLCDGVTPNDLKITYRYLQSHPHIIGVTARKERFDFYTELQWTLDLAHEYNDYE